MTVLSLKLSRVLDVNTQNALELFVGKIKKNKNKNRSFSCCKGRYLLLYSTWVLPFVGTLNYDYKTIIFNLIRIFMKGTLLFKVQKIKK